MRSMKVGLAWVLLSCASVTACSQDELRTDAAPLFSTLDEEDSRNLSAKLAGRPTMVGTQRDIQLWMEATTDSLSSVDRTLMVERFLAQKPQEVREFLRVPSERYLLNSALLPQGAEARLMTLRIPGVAVSTLSVQRIGGPDRVPTIFHGFSADSSISIIFSHDSFVVGELTSRNERWQLRSGDLGDVIFTQDTASYMPEAPPLEPRASPKGAGLRLDEVRPSGVEASRQPARSESTSCAPRDLTLVVAIPSSVVPVKGRAVLEREIQNAVAEAILVFRESNIIRDISVRVIFLETDVNGSSQAVLRDIETANSAASRELVAAVAEHRATGGLLVLERVDDNACGGGFVLLKDRPVLPYAYVLRRCLGQKSLAHELTHWFGANHGYRDVPAFSPRSYGYRNTQADFRTIEATCPADVKCLDRIAMLSDHTKRYGRAPRGASTASSAHAFRESICTLTGVR